MLDLNFSQRMARYQIILDNASIEEIAIVLAMYGYSAQKIIDILTLFKEVHKLTSLQAEEYGDKLEATEAYQSRFNKAYKSYMRLRKIARLLFEDDLEARSTLWLHKEKPNTYNKLFSTASVFYDNMLKNEDYLTVMTEMNCSDRVIGEAHNDLKEMILTKENQLKEAGQAQKATLKRDETMETLDEQMSRLVRVCEIAFEDDPQIMEQLGFVVKA